MNNVIYFIPNLLNYLRLFLLITALYYFNKRPLVAFILVFLSGQIDFYDGTIARDFKQSSKLGFALDLGMDRITTSALFFSCARVYPKHWFIFFCLQFAEIFCDIMDLVFLIHSNYVNSLILIINLNELQFYNQFKSKIFQQAGITSPIQVNQTEIFNIRKDFSTLKIFYPTIFYTSDLFFWLLYLGAFVPKPSLLNESLSELNLNGNLNDTSSPRILTDLNKSHNIIQSRIILSKTAISDLLSIFGNIGLFFEKMIISKFKHLNFLSYKLNFLFRIFCLFCLTGAMLKFYFHLETSRLSFKEIIQYDYKFYDLINKIQK